MANFDLEISGKLKSTTKGNTDWYYGGGNEAWPDLASAKVGVPQAVRYGKTIGVIEAGKIVEYIWHNDDITDNGLVLKTSIVSGITNLSNTPNATEVLVISDTGNDTILASADEVNAGVLPATDKIKLNRLIFSSSRLININDELDLIDTKLDKNGPIVSAAKTKIVYDSNGLVTSGSDAFTSDIQDSLDKRYVTDAEKAKIGIKLPADTVFEIDSLTSVVIQNDTRLAAIEDIYRPPLQSIIQLKALPESSLLDKVRVYVEDSLSDYFYDETAVSGDEFPNDQTLGTGFWKRASASGITNLSNTPNATEVLVISDTGNDTILASANETNAGVLPATDKIKLNRLIFSSSRLININDELDLIDTKVDKVAGKGLSTEDYTTAEKAKLGSIDATHYGAPLQSIAQLVALTEASLVDKVRHYVEDDLSDYFYDATATSGDQAPTDQTLGTGFWRRVSVGGETAASIKSKYESNPDTNAFTDALLAKINSITEIFTTALKSGYDNVVTWVSTNGTNILNHIADVTTNPHNVTKSQIGLGNVDNTADVDKPNSNATIASLALKKEKLRTINPQAGTAYQIVLTDKDDKLIVFNSVSAITLTIPTNTVDPLPIGYETEYLQSGSGKISLETTGLTIVSSSNLVSKIGRIMKLIKIDTDTWVVKGDEMGGELTFGAFPITRSDGELLTNKIFSVNANGDIGLYNITIFSSPFVDVENIPNFSPNVQYNWNMVGDFFTYDTVVTMTGGTISYTEFVNSKLMIVHFTSSATVGYYNLTLNNGITKIFTNYIHITTGTIYPANINSWANVTNATIDESGNVLESTSTLSAHAELIQQQDYLKDFEVTFSLALSPYYPVFMGLNHQSSIGLYDSVTAEQIIRMMFDGGATPISPYVYGRATASYGQQSTPGVGYSTIWRFRWLTGVLTIYRDNTLQLTTTEVITANTKLVLNLKGVDVDQVSYIEL